MSLLGSTASQKVLQGTATDTQEISGKLSKTNTIHGKSAYEIAVIHGFAGTEEEWLNELYARSENAADEAEAAAEQANADATRAENAAATAAEDAKKAERAAEDAASKLEELNAADNYANAFKGTVKGTNIVLTDVSPNQHNVILVCRSKNLIDKAAVTSGVGLSTSTGGTYGDSNLFTTNFIPVNEGESYCINWATQKWGCGYDANKAFVGELTISSGVCVIPSNVAFVRISVALTELDTVQFERGSVKTGYAPYVASATVTVNGEARSVVTGEETEVTSTSPTMTIATETANVITEVTYNKDSNILFDDIASSIVAEASNEVRVSATTKTDGQRITNLPTEIGNITMTEGYGEESERWNYDVAWGSTTRVRTKRGTTIQLKAGDVIGLTDYTDARYYVSYRGTVKNAYYSKGWLTEDFVAPIDGDYIVLIANVTEVVQENASDLGNLLFVEKHNLASAEAAPVHAITHEVKAINHRGYNEVAPENTLPAYKLSRKNGFKYAECDVRWTSDGIPVLLHDESINRTARNADGSELSSTVNIADITYSAALAYDFGIWKSSEYAGTKIPTFDEFMSLCRNIGLHPYIEIEGELTDEQAQTLLGIAKKYGMLNAVTWISFNNVSLQKIVNANKAARVGFLILSIPTSDNHIKSACPLKTPYNEAFVNIRYDLVDSAAVEKWKSVGFPIEVWCPYTENQILALNPYVSGVTTDSLKADEVLRNAAGVPVSGGSGESGATFYPSVSDDGVISWTNDKGLDNPDPVNIKGDKGDDGYSPVRGTDYWTEADKAEIKAYVDDAILGGEW